MKNWPLGDGSGNRRAEQLRQELERLSRQIDRLVTAISNGADALALNEKIKALETRQQELRATLADAVDSEPLIHPNLGELYPRKVGALAEAVNDPGTRAEAFETIRSPSNIRTTRNAVASDCFD